MSKALVVRLDKVTKHPAADNLSTALVAGMFSVVFPTEDHREGDLVVFVCPGYEPNPLAPWWEWLGDPIVKPRRVRGVWSVGIVMKAAPGWQLGQDVSREMNYVSPGQFLLRVFQALMGGL